MVRSTYLRGYHETSGEKFPTMATFLSREGIVDHLHKIIDEAEEELVLISPYIKADDETKSAAQENKARYSHSRDLWEISI